MLLIYVYEGNDLQDNLRDLDHTFFARGFDPQRLHDRGYFRDFVRKTAAIRTPEAEELEAWHWTKNLVAARFVKRLVAAALAGSWPHWKPVRDWSPGSVNRAPIGGEERALPDGLQGPPLELSEEELELALWTHEQAFALLRGRFPEARALVVYLPSPLASYRIRSAEVDIELQRGKGEARFRRGAMAERSDLVCRRIEEITQAGGGEFLDARPKLWELSEREPIHGPLDWKHYNRRGEEQLADAIVPALEAGGQGSCASLHAHMEGGSRP